MKFARFKYDNEVHSGVVTVEGVKVVKGDIFGDWEYTGTVLQLEQLELLAPIVPNNIIGIGANYVSKKDELPDRLPEIPVFFFKPASSIIGPDENIIIPDSVNEVKFESELAVVIGKETKNISTENVLDHIFGYTIGNDVTEPQFFHSHGHWTVGKSFDTFTPLGPFIETALDPDEVYVKAEVNGEEKQNSHTDLMIVPLKNMISYLSNVMTLQPGDVILTGSPLGAHFVKDKDTVECKIDGIGTLRNTTVKTSVSIGS